MSGQLAVDRCPSVDQRPFQENLLQKVEEQQCSEDRQVVSSSHRGEEGAGSPGRSTEPALCLGVCEAVVSEKPFTPAFLPAARPVMIWPRRPCGHLALATSMAHSPGLPSAASCSLRISGRKSQVCCRGFHSPGSPAHGVAWLTASLPLPGGKPTPGLSGLGQ